MKLYKSPNNEIFAYEIDGSQDHIIPETFIQITEEEAEEIKKLKYESDLNLLNYKQKRAEFYPNVFDYIDGVVKGDQVQIQAYIDACLAVKARFPKS